ncbi:MAG: c-type cytochrome [Pseudomonadota bacterium]
MRTIAGLLLLLWLPGVLAADAAELYAEQCAACHGANALGSAVTFSPRLAGQNAAYLREQLLAYQQGRRGVHPDDARGQAMRVLVRDLSMEQVAALAVHLAALTAPAPAQETLADGPGAELYAGHCAICHGQYGQGAESIFVPNLRILSSWYLDAQLVAYENGWRGSSEASTRARGMRSISGQLPDLEQRAAIVTHLAGPRQ